MSAGKINLSLVYTNTGVIGAESGYSVEQAQHIQVVSENVSSGHIVVIEGKILNESNFHVLGTLTGENFTYIDVSTYDLLRLRCTTYDSTGLATVLLTTFVKPSSGIINLTPSSGDSIDSTGFTFKSSDSSISITGDSSDNSIDFQAVGGGGGSTLYKAETFTLDATDISNKYVTLSQTPSIVSEVILDIVGGTIQKYGIDFSVSGTTLSWSTLGLDGQLEVDDVLIVSYIYS